MSGPHQVDKPLAVILCAITASCIGGQWFQHATGDWIDWAALPSLIFSAVLICRSIIRDRWA